MHYCAIVVDHVDVVVYHKINGKYPDSKVAWSHDLIHTNNIVNTGRSIMACKTLICAVFVACVATWGLYRSVDARERVETSNQKKNYLTKLYHTLGLDISGLNELILLGLISDKMNEGLLPRDQEHIKNFNIESLDQNGNFLAQLYIDSLSWGSRCQTIEGVASLDDLIVSINSQRELDAVSCAQIVNVLQDLRSKVGLSSGEAVNNGSNGKEGKQNTCFKLILWPLKLLCNCNLPPNPHLYLAISHG